MNLRTFVISLAMFALTAIAKAQDWSSPDGFLSVKPPNAQSFHAMPMPPSPFLALWVSQDGSTKLGVMQTQLPVSEQLPQASTEEGLADEVGGKVTRLPTKYISGHKVWAMTAQGPAYTCTQALVQDEYQLYKVMAITVGPAADQQAVDQFVGSLAIAQQKTAQPASTPSAIPPNRESSGGVDLHQISKVAGGIAVILGIGLVVYFAMRGKRSR